MYSIGVDIGGTFIKCGIVSNGKILAKDKVPTPKENNEKLIIDTISNLINDLLSKVDIHKHNIENIGVGVAGICDKGICRFMANTNWQNIKLSSCLQQIYGCNVYVVNDLKGATLGELNYGIGKKCKDFVFVGLGTGINIGVVKNGQYIIDGVEFGHIIVAKDGNACGCGKRGCLETMVSSNAFLHYASKICKCYPKDVREVFDLAKVDKCVEKSIYEYIDALNIGIVNICNSYRPEIIVLGGGIGEGLKDYISVINKKLENLNYGYPTAKRTKVVISKIGNDCGLLGVSTLK